MTNPPGILAFLGALIILLGLALTITGWIFVMVDAFQESWVKGLIILLTPFCTCGIMIAYSLYYAMFEYESRYKPWVVMALFGGLGMTGMGWAVMRVGMH